MNINLSVFENWYQCYVTADLISSSVFNFMNQNGGHIIFLDQSAAMISLFDSKILSNIGVSAGCVQMPPKKVV
jgi:hypothetical protein